MVVSCITSTDLIRVLERARKLDDLGTKIAKAMELIEGVLDDLGEEAVAISFNGGKDCTVLLHLFAAVLYARHASNLPSNLQPSHARVIIPPSTHTTKASTSTTTTTINLMNGGQPLTPTAPPPILPPQAQNRTQTEIRPNLSSTHHLPHHHHHRNNNSSNVSENHIQNQVDVARAESENNNNDNDHDNNDDPLPYPPIKSIYITAPNPFTKLEEFVLDCTERYDLDLWRFGGGMKAALEEYLGCGGGKGVRGVLVGTRRGDPNGDVELLAPTDPNWPDFLRIHPILDWTYADVWSFLRQLDVKWCELYDEGYTSLGSTTNTSPNPLLKNPDTPSGWDPAWKLQDESQERAGRGVVPPPVKVGSI